MSSKINLQTCEYACKSSVFQDNQLIYLTQQKKLTTVYLPELKVFHKEDSSSNAAWKSNRKRDINKVRYALESAEAFKKLLLKESGT